jgi:hypothetical protein
VRIFLRLVLLLLLTVAVLRAERSLADARLARELLGPGTWSRVIRVENIRRASRYPAVLHALVFEMAGVLWFYTSTDGTQSFSLHRNRLEAEKADFDPLLKDIDPGFVRWAEVTDEEPTPRAGKSLANGCFVESIAALRQQIGRGVPIVRPRLLSYYDTSPAALAGHTVLIFESVDGLGVIDPVRPNVVLQFPRRLAGDALGLARAIAGPRIGTARMLSLEVGSVRTDLAAVELRSDEAGAGRSGGA